MKLSKLLQAAIENAPRYKEPHKVGLCRIVRDLQAINYCSYEDRRMFIEWIKTILLHYAARQNRATPFIYVEEMIGAYIYYYGGSKRGAQRYIENCWYNFYVWATFDLIKRGN